MNEVKELSESESPSAESLDVSLGTDTPHIPESGQGARPTSQIHWKDKVFTARYSRYVNNDNLCIVLMNAEGGRELTATTNMETLPADQCYIKDWSENTGITASLLRAGLITPVPDVKLQHVGHVRVRLYELTPGALDVLESYELHTSPAAEPEEETPPPSLFPSTADEPNPEEWD